jgi:hypothetical protein
LLGQHRPFVVASGVEHVVTVKRRGQILADIVTE